MDASKAISYLESLAQGKNPITGRPLPPDSPLHDSQVVRALFTAVRLLEADSSSKCKTYTVTQKVKPARTGEKWSESEHQQLREEFKTGQSIHHIARTHQRSRGAIHSRLKLLGIIQDHQSSAISEYKSVSEDNQEQKSWKKDRPQTGKTWTEEEKAQLKALTRKGVPVQEIAQRLGRGPHSVEVQQCKLGLTGNDDHDGENDRLPF